ncbi:glycosyltransferase family A protein [Pseudomonas cichorii]|nr:glycosyltransferase family A protein [Pseudomonas cichorii]
MPEPLISVVIPAYNYALLLPRAIDSVLAQLADDVELVIVNDGSTDDTRRVLDDYQARHETGMTVVHQANAGAAAARNHGVRLARGRYALMLDADDELLPDALALLRQAVTDNPEAGLVLGGQVSVYPDGRERVRQPTPVQGSADQLVRRYLLQKKIAISHCCTLLRRDLLLERPYPHNLRSGEDIPVFAYVLVSAPVALVQQPVARIYKHADSLRHSRADEESVATGLIKEVFAHLPDECQYLLPRYSAQVYLSLFRAAQLAGDYRVARRYYLRAIRFSPVQALTWSYLRKALRFGKR